MGIHKGLRLKSVPFVLNLFSIKPLRPLVLAIARRFTANEASAALAFCVTLAVRLMIASSTRTGTVEEGVASAAHEIYVGRIDRSEGLKQALEKITPSDGRFTAAFEQATVSNRKLARYYLRSLELQAENEDVAWYIPNDDKGIINLEHVLPQHPEGNWPQFSDDELKSYHRRIGNLCLMAASDNSAANSNDFESKREVYSRSPYQLTRELAEYSEWTAEVIAERQARLAQLAPEAWPV